MQFLSHQIVNNVQAQTRSALLTGCGKEGIENFLQYRLGHAATVIAIVKGNPVVYLCDGKAQMSAFVW